MHKALKGCGTVLRLYQAVERLAETATPGQYPIDLSVDNLVSRQAQMNADTVPGAAA
jgi:hypothetical protein